MSPGPWRPAPGITDLHRQFMMGVAARSGAVALRSEHGFLLSSPDQQDRCFVDDFAVEVDEQWASEGRALLLAGWEQARSPGHPVLRVVTARRDEPKRSMLAGLGLSVEGRWWVKELRPTGDASTFGPIDLGAARGVLIPAPPVYDPGGPVCLLGDVDARQVRELNDRAAAHGAVLAIVQREGAPGEVPASEPHLEEAGFHNPSEFYEGRPAA